MGNDRLNAAVDRLLSDRRFLARFRRDPSKAAGALGLSMRETEALKRGDAGELLELGLDPSYVWPNVPTTRAGRFWLARNARRLAPLVFAAGFAAFGPGAGGASAARIGPAPGRIRAARRLARIVGTRRTGLRRAAIRAGSREHFPPGIRRATIRAGRTGVVRALRNVLPDIEPEGTPGD